jgi:hypothetical protein
VNGSLYDSFPSARIDPSKWGSYESVREIRTIGGVMKLDLETRTSTASTRPAQPYLAVSNPENLKAVQARVTPHVLPYVTNTQTFAAVGGWFFNDGTAGGGSVGDVFATAGILATSGGLKAVWSIRRQTDPHNMESYTVLGSGGFATPVSLDGSYQLSVAWDGSAFTFKILAEKAVWKKPAGMKVNSANRPLKGVEVAIDQSAGIEATAEAYFDDIMATYAVPMAEEFAVSSGTNSRLGQSAAFDGTNYLVGIRGNDADLSRINAQLVSKTGGLVGSPIDTGRTGGMPVVAFGGVKYLISWSDDQVVPKSRAYGALIDPSGSVGTPFPIGPTTGVRQEMGPGGIAFDGTRFFVVWEQRVASGASYVYGQRVSTSGVLVGGPIRISTGQGGNPSVAFDGTNYLVVWHDDTSVFGEFISKAGAGVGSNFPIDANAYPSDSSFNTVFFDGTGYVVTVADHRDADTWNHYVRLVGKDGTVSAARVLLYGGDTFLECAAVGFDGTKYLATCNQVTGTSPLTVVSKGRLYNKNWKALTNWADLFGTVGGHVPIATLTAGTGGQYLAITSRVLYDPDPPADQDQSSDATVYGRLVTTAPVSTPAGGTGAPVEDDVEDALGETD